MDKVSAADADAMAELDALDQIGAAVIAAAGAYFGEDHNRRLVEALTRRAHHSRRRTPKDRHRRRGKTVSSPVRWSA